jgi:indole-3-acetate monooxygenase
MLCSLVPVDVDAVKEAAERISGLVRARAAEIDRGRRLPDDLVSALRCTGIYRMFMPTLLGGSRRPSSTSWT